MNVCNGMIEKVHPVGQAITLISNKYDLPYEIEKMIQDIIFKNKLPKIDMEDRKSKHYKVRYKYDHLMGSLDPFSLERFRTRINFHGFKVFSQPHPHAQWVYPKIDLTSGISSYTTVPELKATLKELIKYNKLKIPISKLKRNELIALLIHTEF